jgi:hypothetical protein
MDALRKLVLSLVMIVWGVMVPFAEVQNNPRENLLWEENFRNVSPDEWSVINGKFADTEQLVFVSGLPSGGKAGSFGKIFPWNAKYPYLQVKVDRIESTAGYKSWYVRANNKVLFYLGGAEIPGIFTFNLLQYPGRYSPFAPDKEVSNVQLSFQQYAGIYTYGYVRMMAQPENALIVEPVNNGQSEVDGNIIREIKRGDKLLFHVLLEKPAVDVTVTIMSTYCLSRITLDGEEYVQLVKTDEEGKQWKAEVRITDKATKVKRPPGAVLFKATVLGGDIRETFTANALPVSIE